MTEIEKVEQKLREYIAWREFPRRYPELLSEVQLRQLLNGRHFNGFGKCVRQISAKRILLHVPSTLDWIESAAYENQKG